MKRKKTATRPKRVKSSGTGTGKKQIEQYEHKDKKRANIPPVGLVTPETDPIAPTPPASQYQYDPHLDPQLVWAGKAERTSFEIPTVSLHVHERIDPRTIMEAVKSKNGNGHADQLPLFGRPEENRPLREEFPFYDHKKPLGWKNRLIAGDSLLVMNSLLEKEGLGGQVQMVYIDPPYGIRYGSNFQPFTNKRDVKDGADDDLTLEPETLKAFRDTWELGVHSYLTYLRDRLLLAKELLHESGSCFVQISDENVHRVRDVMDEIFGADNAMPQIVFRKTTGAGSPSGYVESLPQTFDFLVWYARDRKQCKIRRLYFRRSVNDDVNLRWVESPAGQRRRMSEAEILNPNRLPEGTRVFRPNPLTSQTGGDTTTFEVEFEGQKYKPQKGGWKTNREGMQALRTTRRLMPVGNTLCFVRYLEDFPYIDRSSISGMTPEQVALVIPRHTWSKRIQR